MKIIHISIYPLKNEKHSNAGGVASYSKNLVINIPYQKNDEVFILCNKIDGKYEKYIEDNITVVRCFDKTPKYFFQILKEIKKIKPDVIHIQQELALFGGVITAYLLQWLLFLLKKYKLIITLHGVVFLKKIDKNFIKENNSSLPIWLTKIGFYVVYKPLCVWTKKIIVHEEYFKNILINEYKVKKDKIEVIYHGIEDLECIPSDNACKTLGIDSKKDICLFMGYLTGYKGIDLLINGFSEYCKINKNAFLIIGAGKHPKLKDDEVYLKKYKRLEDKAKNLIPKNQYRWVGFIDECDIINYYSACDVVLAPYTIAMSSSGPLALAIGYEKSFLASDVFSEILPKQTIFKRTATDLAMKLEEFFNDQERFVDVAGEMKKMRLWGEVGNFTYKNYLKI